MPVSQIIRRKRDGGELTPAEVRELVLGYARAELPDYQMSALLMAIVFRGLTPGETAAWLDAMIRSGIVVDFSHVPGVKVDKHSTGGIGDKVSLCLAPLVAACGVPVPMMSGRGLGHTGGTLDKLESIPGFRTDQPVERFRKIVARCGLALVGQTSDLVPADRRLYALRDVTATVESVPLITASILSKKIAEGADALVLDVKVGDGAFMKTPEDARTLARSLVRAARAYGKPLVALLTRMDRPLGRTAGNALEAIEAIDVLQGRGPADVVELTLALGAEMLVLGGRAANQLEARARLRRALDDGSGLERFRAVVEAQGGDPRAVDDTTLLPRAPKITAVHATRSGWIDHIGCETVGWLNVELGAGRRTSADAVDPGVGMVFIRNVGDRVEEGDTLVEVHHRDEPAAADVVRRLADAVAIGDAPPGDVPLVLERIDE
ncbi:MAG: thymidine phosphorylase [Deltaproteobacteria bacterium]|nr:thymidine phosphorylase [Deltaproteobacteria bacterium]